MDLQLAVATGNENVENEKETFANEDRCKRTTMVSSQDKPGHFL